jgi:DNA-binding XRE family transcriptional regulator
MAKKPKAPVEPETAKPLSEVVGEVVQAPKRTFGRPSKYDPSMLEDMKKVAIDGASKAEMALTIGISRETFNNWEHSNPIFRDAVKECELLSQIWWERHGRKGMTGENPDFNSTAFIFQVKNRFRSDYMDTSRTEVTGKDGGPVQMEAKVVDVDNLDDEQIALLEAALLSAKGNDE